MKIDRIEGGQDEQGGDEADAPDRRRARLADVQRVEAALNAAAGKIEAIEKMLAEQEVRPVSKAAFLANYFTNMALSGVSRSAVAHRQVAEAAYAEYCKALAGEPVPSIEERWRRDHPAEVAAKVNTRPLSEPTPKGEPTPAVLSPVNFTPTVTVEVAKA